MNSEPKYVTSKKELAEILGISKPTAIAWSRLPGAPFETHQGYPVDEWIDFAEKVAKRARESSDEREALKMQLLVEVLRAKKMTNEERAGRVVPLDEFKAVVFQMVEAMRVEMRNIRNNLPLQLEGMNVAEMGKAIDEAFDKMQLRISHRGESVVTQVSPRS